MHYRHFITVETPIRPSEITSLQRTCFKVPNIHFPIYVNTFWTSSEQTTSLQKDKTAGPNVSFVQRFYCTTVCITSQLHHSVLLYIVPDSASEANVSIAIPRKYGSCLWFLMAAITGRYTSHSSILSRNSGFLLQLKIISKAAWKNNY